LALGSRLLAHDERPREFVLLICGLELLAYCCHRLAVRLSAVATKRQWSEHETRLSQRQGRKEITFETLTTSERKVVALLADGYDIEAISKILNVQRLPLGAQVYVILGKTGCSDIVDLVRAWKSCSE